MPIPATPKSGWKTICIVFGVFSFLFAIIAFFPALRYVMLANSPELFEIHQPSPYEVAPFIALIASGFHFFFMAWCIGTATDIRHYCRLTAIALNKDPAIREVGDNVEPPVISPAAD